MKNKTSQADLARQHNFKKRGEFFPQDHKMLKLNFQFPYFHVLFSMMGGKRNLEYVTHVCLRPHSTIGPLNFGHLLFLSHIFSLFASSFTIPWR
jgi:hypothetical protein